MNALAWEMSLLSNKMFGFNGCWKVGKQFTGESTQLCNFDFQLVSVKPEISPWKYCVNDCKAQVSSNGLKQISDKRTFSFNVSN